MAVAFGARKREGVITLADTEAAGMTARQVERLIASGQWRREYRGVFIDNAVPITPMQPVIAAAEAVGAASVASHRLCIWLWELTHERTAPSLEFTVAGRNPRPPGITVYRAEAYRTRTQLLT